jgi:hypothetical protein
MLFLKEYIKKTGKFDFKEFEKLGFDGFNDKKFILWSIRKCRDVKEIVKYFPMRFRNDEEIMLEAIEYDNEVFKHLGSKLKYNKEFIKKAIKLNPHIIKYLPRKIFTFSEYEALTLEAVKEDCEGVPAIIDNKFKIDKNLALKVVKRCGEFLEYVSNELKADKEIVLEAVKNFPYMFYEADEKLKDDKEIALIVIKNNPYLFDEISDRLKIDDDVLSAFFNSKNFDETYFPDFFCDKLKEIFLNSDKLEKNYTQKDINIKNVILMLVKYIKTGKVEFNLNDRKFILFAIENCRFLLLDKKIVQYLYKNFKDDEEIILKIIKENPDSFKYLEDKLKYNKDFIKKALEVNPSIISLIPKNIFTSEEYYKLILQAVETDCGIFRELDEKYRKDKQIMLEALKGWPCIPFDNEVITDLEILKKAVEYEDKSPIKHATGVIQCADKNLRDNKEIALIAVKNHWRAFDLLSDRLKEDKDILLTLINANYFDSFVLPDYLCKKIQNYFKEKRKTTRIHPKYDNEELKTIVEKIGLTLEEYEEILDEVNSINDEELKHLPRKEYELKKYTLITKPSGERFEIPGISPYFNSEYIYQYANFMKILVNDPKKFLLDIINSKNKRRSNDISRISK